MHQPSDSRKYALFPTKDKLSISLGRKSPDSETVSNTAGEKQPSILGSALRLKPKEQSLVRRRKVSVPELGPMTTVQEVAMDSREFHLILRPRMLNAEISSHNTWKTTFA